MPKFLPHNGEFARKAAIAALAAGEQGKFWEFNDKLFAAEGAISDAKILAIAEVLKLDMDRFKRKMLDPTIEEVIEKDLAEATKLDVHWTPQVYLNGRVFTGRSLPDFVSAIEGMLKR